MKSKANANLIAFRQALVEGRAQARRERLARPAWGWWLLLGAVAGYALAGWP